MSEQVADVEEQVDYSRAREMIAENIEIGNLRNLVFHHNEVMKGLKSLIGKRIMEIAISEGLAYHPSGPLGDYEVTFPHRDSQEFRRNGVTYLRNNVTDAMAFIDSSVATGTWMAGEPEAREDGLYSHLTGEKISD